MAEGDELSYLDEVVEESTVLFASSNAVLTIADPKLHPIGKSIGIFLLFICLFGFLNGLDYASPDDGLVRPDEFVYRLAQTAPEASATFRGTVSDHQGEPLSNATLYLSWKDTNANLWRSVENLTDEQGAFTFERLNPGLIRVDIIVERDGYRDVYSNRVLLSPPALIEPIGFTTLDFSVPSEGDFAAAPCDASEGAECEIRTIDMTPLQLDHPLMDPSAATGYILVGFGFMGLALISAGFALWALKSGSVALLRTSSVLVIFTMGHYYSACMLGLMAFVLTFAVPRRQIPLT